MKATLIRTIPASNGNICVYNLTGDSGPAFYRGHSRIGIYEDMVQGSMLVLPVVNESDVPLRNGAIHRYWVDDHLVIRDANNRFNAVLEMCGIDAPDGPGS